MKLRPGNAQHQGARDTQQDSFGFSDLENHAFVAHGGLLGVVADGMGGMAHGGAAGAVAVQTFLKIYGRKRADQPIAAGLDEALHGANDAVVHLARAAGQPDDVGTTLAAIVVHGPWLHWIAAGDTRVYLWRDGSLTQVTSDHVYAAQLDAQVATGEIGEAAAAEHPDRDALTSHLGIAPLPAVERSVRAFPLRQGDRVLVCTDGLYRALSLDDMAEPLAGRPQRACEALVDAAVSRRLAHQDNVTAIAIGLDPEGDVSTGHPGVATRAEALT